MAAELRDRMTELKRNLEDAGEAAREIRIRAAHKTAPGSKVGKYNPKKHHNRGGKA